VPPFDESPEAYYNVIPDALLVNKNMLQIDMRSTDKARAGGMQPELDKGVTVGSDMKLVDADCEKLGRRLEAAGSAAAGRWRIKVMLHGTFPKNCVTSYASMWSTARNTSTACSA
jgi:D-alanyl-D-alanine carboxypeptidase/D-alanyl-D-alanine-endopeptidase (penicillin-binding protein 4)